MAIPRGRRVVGASVRGVVHQRDGLPNQDAMAWAGPSGPDGRLVVAVSDGHGSHKAFRSDTGARLAVEVGVESGQTFAGSIDRAGRAGFDDAMFSLLAQEIVEQWAAAVGADLAVRALGEDELAVLAELDGPAARQAVEGDPVLAYGATLLLAVVGESFALFVQLGDGDILVVPASGPVTRPLPDDARLLGNETTSLCMPGADREFRFACRPLADDATVLLLATDGLGNAYPDEGSFRQVGADLLERIRSGGLDAVAHQLDDYLREVSIHSGDDVTVAVVWLGTAEGTAQLDQDEARTRSR